MRRYKMIMFHHVVLVPEFLIFPRHFRSKYEEAAVEYGDNHHRAQDGLNFLVIKATDTRDPEGDHCLTQRLPRAYSVVVTTTSSFNNRDLIIVDSRNRIQL